MDTNNYSLIKLDDEIVDITLLSILRLVPMRDGKAIVKQLPFEPIVGCCKEDCEEFADVLIQYIGNDRTFAHVVTCYPHADGAPGFIQETLDDY